MDTVREEREKEAEAEENFATRVEERKINERSRVRCTRSNAEYMGGGEEMSDRFEGRNRE